MDEKGAWSSSHLACLAKVGCLWIRSGFMVAGRLGATGGLDVVVVVVVVVVLVVGYVNVDIIALVGMKNPISSFLDLFFFWDLLGCALLLFVGAVLLQKVVWSQTGVKGLTFFLCSTVYALIFFQSKWKGCTCLLQGCNSGLGCVVFSKGGGCCLRS